MAIGTDFGLAAESGWSDTQTIVMGNGGYSNITAKAFPTPTSNPPTPTQSAPNPTVSPNTPPVQNATEKPLYPQTETNTLFGLNWEQAALGVLAVVIAVMAVGMGVLWRKVSKK